MSADGYAESLLVLRNAVDRYEHVAAMVASGHNGYLKELTELSTSALRAAHELATWCAQQGRK